MEYKFKEWFLVTFMKKQLSLGPEGSAVVTTLQNYFY